MADTLPDDDEAVAARDALTPALLSSLAAGECSVLDAYDLARRGLAVVLAPPPTRRLKLTDLGRRVLKKG